ncbi:hypothetical protein [Exiguobacterium acetylicum]|uniref:hypothetical protein n=1 Tax=Exiguobacterium acetylicum TaxID=41170 RepID=UPI0034D496B1
MSDLIKDEKKLPLSIDFLYNNNILDVFNMLCVLNGFRNKRSGMTVDELTFFLSIVTSRNFNNLIQAFEKSPVDQHFIVLSNYYYYESKIRKLILNASDLGLISFTSNKEEKIDYNFKIKISISGAEKIEALEDNFFKDLIAKITKTKITIKYKKTNLSILQGGIL